MKSKDSTAWSLSPIGGSTTTQSTKWLSLVIIRSSREGVWSDRKRVGFWTCWVQPFWRVVWTSKLEKETPLGVAAIFQFALGALKSPTISRCEWSVSAMKAFNLWKKRSLSLGALDRDLYTTASRSQSYERCPSWSQRTSHLGGETKFWSIVTGGMFARRKIATPPERPRSESPRYVL